MLFRSEAEAVVNEVLVEAVAVVVQEEFFIIQIYQLMLIHLIQF